MWLDAATAAKMQRGSSSRPEPLSPDNLLGRPVSAPQYSPSITNGPAPGSNAEPVDVGDFLDDVDMGPPTPDGLEAGHPRNFNNPDSQPPPSSRHASHAQASGAAVASVSAPGAAARAAPPPAQRATGPPQQRAKSGSIFSMFSAKPARIDVKYTHEGRDGVFLCALLDDVCVEPCVTQAAGGLSKQQKKPSFRCTFSVTPALPEGVYLENTLGILYGRPSQVSATMTNHTIEVCGPAGQYGAANIAILVHDPEQTFAEGAARARPRPSSPTPSPTPLQENPPSPSGSPGSHPSPPSSPPPPGSPGGSETTTYREEQAETHVIVCNPKERSRKSSMNAVYARGFGSRVSGPMVCDMIVPDPKDCSAPLRNRREETEDAVIVCEMGPVDFALQVKKDI